MGTAEGDVAPVPLIPSPNLAGIGTVGGSAAAGASTETMTGTGGSASPRPAMSSAPHRSACAGTGESNPLIPPHAPPHGLTASDTPVSPCRDEHSGDPYHSGYEMPYSGGGAGPAYGPPQPWAHPDMHVMQHHILPIQAR